MTPWQVLRASGAIQAALGYRVHHGHGGLVHYSTAAAAALDGSRSFCLSTEKVTLQQLNSRLASYLQQVQCLEEANQKLEFLIQQELDRKCPRQLRELDGHLRVVSLLQDQISECLSDQAEMKLQLLHAELISHDLSMRYEKEQERHGSLEVELSNLRLLEEELQVHRLPELQMLLNDRTQQLMELQVQHQQDMQCLKAQMTGGITVEMQPAQSLDLTRQLDNLRQTNVTLLNENQNNGWFNTQVSMLNSPEVTFDPPAGSEIIQAELEELRTRAASLEQELTQLQALNAVLEATGLEQNDSIIQELEVLQQRADGLCSDLDSLLQVTAQQAVDHQILLEVATRLETEIQDYMRLLDGLSPQGFSGLHPNYAANVTSVCVTTSPSFLRRQDFTVSKTANVQEGNLRMMEFQAVSNGHMQTIQQTPEVTPLAETATTVQSISKHLKNSPVTLINTSNQNGLFNKSESQRIGTLPKSTVRESTTISATKNRQSISGKDKVHTKGLDLQNSSIVTAQLCQGSDNGSVVKACKPETNSAQGVTMLVSDTQSIRSIEVGLQANKQKTVIQTEMTKTIPFSGPEVKPVTNVITHSASTDPSKPTTTEVKKETEMVSSVQMNCNEGSIQAKNQDPAQVVSLSLQTPTKDVGNAEECAGKASSVSGSHIIRSEEAHGKISVESNLICANNLERQEMKDRKEAESVLRLDQGATLSKRSSSQQIIVMEDAHTESDIGTASSGSPDSNGNLENKPAQGITILVPETQPSTEAGLQDNETETSIQTVITKTTVCVEPEVKKGPHFITPPTMTDSAKQTTAEVKKETETVISAQLTSTEESIQAKNQDHAQVVSLSLQTPTEAVKDAEEVAVIPGPHIDRTEVAQGEASGDLTLMDENNTERQEKKEGKEVEEVQSSSHGVELDHISTLSTILCSEQIKVMEVKHTGSEIATASSGSEDSSDNLESKTAQGITTLVPKTQSIMSPAAVQEKPETLISIQTSTETGLQDNETETNIQTVATKTTVCVEPEAKQEPHLLAQTKITDSSAPTAAEVKKETEIVISVQLTSTEESIQAKNQDPAQVVSLSLQTPTEAVKDAEEETVTASFIPGPQIDKIEEASGEDSGDLTLMDENNTEGQEKKEEKEAVAGQHVSHAVKLDQIAALSNASCSEEIKEKEDALTGFKTAPVSSDCADNSDNLESKTAQGITTLVPKTQSIMSPAAVQEKPETLISKQTITDTGLQDNETETNIQTVATKTTVCVEPEVEKEPHFVIHPTITDSSKQMAAEVKKETVISAQMTSTEESIQAKNQDPAQVVSLSLQTPTEAVKDAEEVAVTASFIPGPHIDKTEEAQGKVTGDLTLMDENNIKRQEKKGGKEIEGTLPVCRSDQIKELSDASISEKIQEKDNEHTGSKTAPASSDCTERSNNLESKTAQGVITSALETQSIMSPTVVQEKPETPTSIQTATETGLQDNETETNIQTVMTKTTVCVEPEVKKGPHFITPPTMTDSAKQTTAEVKKETETVISAQLTSTEESIPAKNQDPAQVVSLSLQTDPSKSNRLDQTLALSDAFKSKQITVMKDAVARSGLATISSFGGSLGHTSMSLFNTGTKESPSEASSHAPATSQQETRKFSNRGSGAWIAKGGSPGRKSSLDGSTSLPNKGKEESQSVDANPTTSIQETGRFSSSRRAEWIVYSGSLGRKSSLRRAWSEENQSGVMLPATSLPEIRRFGGGGSGSLKRTSILAGSDDIFRKDKEEFPSVTLQKASSTPEALGGGRFGSGGSVEWRVYGGSTGRSSSAGSIDKASNQKISQPSKHRGSEPRLSRTDSAGSTGSGSRLSSGSIVRHSNSAGSSGGLSSSSSGGRLSSSSSSQRISTSRKFTSTGSGEWKPVYSSANARKSSVGSAGRSGGGGTISSQRAPSSGGRMVVSMGSGGWLSSSTAGISSPGSGSKLSSSGGSDRISILAGGKIGSSSGSGRTNSTGGRVISSSDWPIRSTGSGAGGNKERISVCKMAALSISAAGRERNQGRQEQPQRPQQQHRSGATSPLLQRWLTTGVGIKSANPDGLDDITD